MKPNLRFIILIILSFFGCSPSVSFDEPQPSDTKSLNEFPDKLHGEYLNKSNNQLLIISDKLIKVVCDFDQKENKNHLDSNIKLTGDTLLDTSDSSKTLIRYEGDSIVMHFHSEDTLFSISDKNILKKYKGYYFLNVSNTPYWNVKKMHLTKGILSVNSISTKEEINTLREITETISDTTSYNFKPTKRQFKKFIKQDGFKDSEYYIRLK